MTSANPSPPAVAADVAGRPGTSAWADLDQLSFAPTSRVLRRSEREIQIERAEDAIVVADLPEWVIAHLHRRHPPRQPTAETATTSARGRDRAASAKSSPAVDRSAGDSSAGAIDRSPLDHDHLDHDDIDHDDVGRVLRSLTRAGYLVRRDEAVFARSASGRMAALEPDLIALDDRFGRHARGVLERRHGANVRVHGMGRLAPLVASLLAAAGVGQVHVPDSGNVSLDDVLPGGLLPTDEGQRTALAAAEAVRRARPGGVDPPPATAAGDLLISTDGYPVAAHLRAELMAEPRPHLVTGVWGSHGVIGPLIVPGHTSCLHCADLHRRDRDPAWPALSAQLARSGRPSGPSEVAVCTLTAAVTVLQALAFLDGERPATVDGTLEFRLPDWRLRRRHWDRHAHCPCAA